MMRSILLAAVVGLAALPAEAQNSAYGILGIGFPARLTAIRARAMGDGSAAVDLQSGVNPATTSMANALSVIVGASQEYRTMTLAGQRAEGLHQARFPYLMVTGRLGTSRLSYSLGYRSYAERTFEISSTDTIQLRGVPVVVNDNNGSAGAVVDSRGTLTVTFNRRWAAGLGIHVLGGSARLTARRTFSDSAYRGYVESNDNTFSGFGVSVGVLANPTPAIRAGFSARVDGKLRRTAAGVSQGNVKLPAILTAGFEARLAPAARVAGNASWRSWSTSGGGIGTAVRAFDTFEAGVGLELGGGTVQRPRPPLRLGVRYATLPFSPTADQPRELDLSAGTRIRFRRSPVQFDFTVEHGIRDGGNVSERAWQFHLGFELTPGAFGI